ncbi:hypothetical protein [Paramicrobacterium chengjingii]|uniref:Uncharacterized protein n=1 Tax=Paramicrobacterium chengjingii TaxID=2769067 RepID=A0ABX6YLE4_9MICO|nr:hypothetical protein [Microbacterium chengjingii]QPZ39613.1 hypothetical protein HCR76_06050 [Microbacterium chengjingii]
MSTAEEPVRRQESAEQSTDLQQPQVSGSELASFRSWLPVATPTEGQPYKTMKELKEHPPSDRPHVVHPCGIDSHGSLF